MRLATSPVLRRAAVLLFTGALPALALVTAPPASAATVPATPEFGAAIDAYSRYVAETTCSPTEKPGVDEFRDLLVRTYGSSRWNNIVRPCSASSSGHEEGRSLDIEFLSSNATDHAKATDLLTWLLATDRYGNKHANARRLGIMYVQYNDRMWRAYDPDRGWAVDGSCSSSSFSTGCHDDHIHFSFGWDGANAKTSWFTGGTPATPSCAVPATLSAPPAAPAAALGYLPLTPARVLDTRTGLGAPGGAACRMPAGGRIDLTVAGRGGVPSTGAAAVVLNVTAVAPSATTYVTAWPAGAAKPASSSLNVTNADTRASLVVARVGTSGRVSLANAAGSLSLVADVVGWFPAAGSGAEYHPVTPARLLDTRATGPALPSGGARTLDVTRSGVPSTGVTAVVLNVTVPGGASSGYVSVQPGDVTSAPTTSTVNFKAGSTRVNRAISRIAASNGTIRLYASTSTHVVVDVVGWFGSGAGGGGFHPVGPTRLLDTRTGTGGISRLAGGTPKVLGVAGRAGVPAGASAVVMTLTGTGTTTGAYLTAWKNGTDNPRTSDVNVGPGVSVANLGVVALSPNGYILLESSSALDVVGDVVGYFD